MAGIRVTTMLVISLVLLAVPDLLPNSLISLMWGGGTGVITSYAVADELQNSCDTPVVDSPLQTTTMPVWVVLHRM